MSNPTEPASSSDAKRVGVFNKRKRYKDAALDYLRRGWLSPLPLPSGAKYPPPSGWTGSSAPYADRAQVKEWATGEHSDGNLALRLNDNVIAIDVDTGHGNKQGAADLAAFERMVGATFPRTWSSSAREDGSRQMFYRVPERLFWLSSLPTIEPDGTEVGKSSDVQVIHRRHRYSVVSPSTHPETETQYRWRDPKGNVSLHPPHVEDLTELPDALASNFRLARLTCG